MMLAPGAGLGPAPHALAVTKEKQNEIAERANSSIGMRGEDDLASAEVAALGFDDRPGIRRARPRQ